MILPEEQHAKWLGEMENGELLISKSNNLCTSVSPSHLFVAGFSGGLWGCWMPKKSRSGSGEAVKRSGSL